MTPEKRDVVGAESQSQLGFDQPVDDAPRLHDNAAQGTQWHEDGHRRRPECQAHDQPHALDVQGVSKRKGKGCEGRDDKSPQFLKMRHKIHRDAATDLTRR